MPVVVDLAAAVARAKRNGERQEIHRRPYRRVKPIPARLSMFQPHHIEIETWLDAQPAMTAVDVLARLKDRHPDRFKASRLRIMQRLVKGWRADQAARIVRHEMEALTPLPIAGMILPLARDPAVSLSNIAG